MHNSEENIPGSTSSTMDSDIYQCHEARAGFQLHLAMKDKSITEREEAVKLGVRQLAMLRGILLKKSNESLNFSQWNAQIHKALGQAALKKAVIGVVGNTGAGKTSLINAILGEGQLLPTNCMRACTATVTEISYNQSLSKYVAEIEYVSPSEWKEDLEIGWNILFDENGRIVRDATNEDTDAGVFYAKLKAVYTDLTRDHLAVTAVDALMAHPNTSVLGKVDKIEEDNAVIFSKRLQLMIDSKEHSDEEDTTKKSNAKRRANWPLIRKAKIFVKSSALSTGVTLVDLPGVQDSNPARAKIATDYLRQCSGLLVAAPIHRAVDDKVARSLLGKPFKRQVMMDGGFNTVTFVCTKADDISIAEASRSPQISLRIAELVKEADEHDIAIATLKEELAELRALKDEADNDLSEAYDMQDQMEDIFRANQNLNNGFGGGIDSDSPKKRKHHQSNGGDQSSPPTAVDSEETKEQSQLGLDASDVDVMKANISHWKNKRAQAKNRLREINDRIKATSNLLNDRELRLAATDNAKVSLCITERNLYVEQALKRDFVTGVKEFDQERLGDENGTAWDPSVEHRDYAKLYDELPVFCVSSKAFLKMLGHLKEEPEMVGFSTKLNTGIPQLQEHCKQLTDAGRIKSAGYFLAMMSALLNSLRLWISNELNGSVLTEQQRIVLKQVLGDELALLREKLLHIVSAVCAEVKDRIRNHIYKGFEPARLNALKEANDTAKEWGKLAHQTWRAICVRNGSFENGNGKYDWNEELVEPILNHLAPEWEATFNDLLNKTFRKFGVSCRKKIKEFHRSIPDLLSTAGSKVQARHRMLQSQLESYKHTFVAIEDYGKDFVSSQQKIISRAFKPVIRDAMSSAYKKCLGETGTGSWNRMKELMATHIASSPEMFRDSTKTVQAQLDALITEVKENMKKKVEAAHDEIYHDYMSTLVGGAGDGLDGDRPTGLVDDLLKFVDGAERAFNRLSASTHAGIKVEDFADMRQGEVPPTQSTQPAHTTAAAGHGSSQSSVKREKNGASKIFDVNDDEETDDEDGTVVVDED